MYFLLGLSTLGAIIIGILSCLLYFRPFKAVAAYNKAVLITGCDSGFGLSLAKTLLRHGYVVFAGCLFPDTGGGAEAKAAAPDRCFPVKLDVTSDEDVAAAAGYVKQHLMHQDLWAVVNNAGIANFTESEWCPISDYEKLMNVNTLGAVRVTNAFLPLIRKCKGRVVNIASQAGRFALPGFCAYSTSKAALIAYSDVLRREMQKFDVSVITIEPGLYRTPITEQSLHVRYNQKIWSGLPQDIREAYGGDRYLEAMVSETCRNLSHVSDRTYLVDQALVHAVTSSWPKKRYIPDPGRRLMLLAAEALPQTLVDACIAVFMPLQCGMTTPEKCLERFGSHRPV